MAAALPASCGGEEVGGVQARQRMSVATDLAQASQEDLTRFDAIEERSIDYADIPELGDNFFRKAKKKSITARFDADMVQWFKAQGKGYQTRMNAVLRAFYEHHRD